MLQEMEWRSARGARIARQAGIPPLITAPNKTKPNISCGSVSLISATTNKYT